jgi:hypothetical protein
MKNVLADNPLDLVMGFGRKPAPAPSAAVREEGRVVEPPKAEPPKAEPSNVVSITMEPAPTVEAPAARSARVKRPQPKRPARPEADAEESASLKHRIGTIKAPYSRADGTLVRQWSITLPVDVIRRMNHLAIDRGVKPAELALQAIEGYLDASE